MKQVEVHWIISEEISTRLHCCYFEIGWTAIIGYPTEHLDMSMNSDSVDPLLRYMTNYLSWPLSKSDRRSQSFKNKKGNIEAPIKIIAPISKSKFPVYFPRARAHTHTHTHTHTRVA